MQGPNSDVIELIIGIDLNPENPDPVNAPHAEPDGDEGPGKLMAHHGGGMPMGKHGMGNGCEPDWKSLCKQLLQTVSLMDTQTDAAMDGEMSDEEAIKAIDQMTSRVLWGKQEESNPFSSYQNANYGKSVAAGMVMKNPAQLFNGAAYGDNDPDSDGDVDVLNGRPMDSGGDEPHGFSPMKKKPKKPSGGFGGASKKMFGKDEDEEDDDDEPAFDDGDEGEEEDGKE